MAAQAEPGLWEDMGGDVVRQPLGHHRVQGGLVIENIALRLIAQGVCQVGRAPFLHGSRRAIEKAPGVAIFAIATVVGLNLAK